MANKLGVKKLKSNKKVLKSSPYRFKSKPFQFKSKPITAEQLYGKFIKVLDSYKKGAKKGQQPTGRRPYISPKVYRKKYFGTERFLAYRPPTQRSVFQILPLPYTIRHFPFDLFDFEIRISPNGKKYFTTLQKLHPYRYKSTLNKIIASLLSIQAHVQMEMKPHIYRYVPEETGALRESLYLSLSKDLSIIPSMFDKDPDHIVLKMGLFSDIPYLQYLNYGKIRKGQNKGKKLKLAHHGNVISRRTGRPLYDPHAKAGFMGLLKLRMKNIARKHIKTMLSNMTVQTQLNYRAARSLFTIKGLGKI